MLNVFDNTASRNCARKMKEMGFFGDYIIAVRTSSSERRRVILKALRLGWLKSSIVRLGMWKITPQGFHFWEHIFNQL